MADVETRLVASADAIGALITCIQSNAEHEMVDAVHQAKLLQVDFVLINPGAFTHTSIALRDALLGVAIPFIEVHISTSMLEEFRHHSYLSDVAVGVIAGLGTSGYDWRLPWRKETIRGQSVSKGAKKRKRKWICAK